MMKKVMIMMVRERGKEKVGEIDSRIKSKVECRCMSCRTAAMPQPLQKSLTHKQTYRRPLVMRSVVEAQSSKKRSERPMEGVAKKATANKAARAIKTDFIVYV